MLQYPYGIYPSGSTIDTSEPFNLKLIVSGTDCIAYQLQILENVTGNNYYDGTKVNLPLTLYNNDELSISVTDVLPTGKDYIYNYTLWTTLPDIPVVTGVVLQQINLLTFYVGQFTNIKVGHTITINGEQKIIQSYQFDETLVKGILTINEPFSDTIQDNTSFKVTSNFIETPYYYFQSAKTPVLSLNNVPETVASRMFDFVGNYSQQENIPVQKYKYELYVKDADVYSLIQSTNDVYSAKLSYSYDGFVNQSSYRISLTTTNQRGIVSIQQKDFVVLYNETATTGTLFAESNYDNHSVRLTFQNIDKTNILYWDIYREQVGELSRQKIGRISVNSLGIEDFSVVNNKTYKWIAIPLTTDATSQSLESNEVSMSWDDWSLTSLSKVDNNYIPTKIVKLNLNLESADMVQNLDVAYHKNYTQYPKESRGESNYLTGSITCLLGKIQMFKYTENFSINDWRSLAYSGEIQLLKDRQGNKYLVSITSSSSNVDDVSVEQLNQISFTFTEIQNSSLSNNVYIEHNTDLPYIADLKMEQRNGNLYVNYNSEIFPLFNISNQSLYVDYEDRDPLDIYINSSGELIQKY